MLFTTKILFSILPYIEAVFNRMCDVRAAPGSFFFQFSRTASLIYANVFFFFPVVL